MENKNKYRCKFCEGKPFECISKHLMKNHIFQEHEYNLMERIDGDLILNINPEDLKDDKK